MEETTDNIVSPDSDSGFDSQSSRTSSVSEGSSTGTLTPTNEIDMESPDLSQIDSALSQLTGSGTSTTAATNTAVDSNGIDGTANGGKTTNTASDSGFQSLSMKNSVKSGSMTSLDSGFKSMSGTIRSSTTSTARSCKTSTDSGIDSISQTGRNNGTGKGNTRTSTAGADVNIKTVDGKENTFAIELNQPVEDLYTRVAQWLDHTVTQTRLQYNGKQLNHLGMKATYAKCGMTRPNATYTVHSANRYRGG